MNKSLLKEYILEQITLILESYKLSRDDIVFIRNLPNTIEGIEKTLRLVRKRKLPYISKGTARIVYAISTDKVLKVAGNERGFLQNKEELNSYISSNIPKYFLPKIYDYSQNGLWLISELTKPFNYEYFFKETGGVSSHEIRKDIMDALKNNVIDIEQMPDRFKNINNIEFRNNVFDLFIRNPIISYDDFSHDQFGKTEDGRIVMIDTGVV